MKSVTLGASALVVIAAPLSAQLRMETGGGESRLDQLPATSLTSVGGSVDARFGRAHMEFSGNAEDHFGLGIAGVMSGGLHYRITESAWTVEVGPVSEAARGIGEQWAGILGGDLRAERSFGPVTLHGGWQQGIARTASQQTSWHRPDASAELQIGAIQISTTWQKTVVQDGALRVAPAFIIDAGSDTLFRGGVQDIQDVTANMGLNLAGMAISARLGRRFGATVVPQTWWEGHVALKLTPIMSVTVKTGHVVSDPVLRLRGGQYTTLGLRIDLLQRSEHNDRVFAATATLAEVVRESMDTVQLVFVLPASTRDAVLAGDLTEWRSLKLTRAADGRWQVTVAARTGIYRINIRTNDGPWRVPPGLPTTQDGFGAKVGLLVLDQ